MAPEDSGREVWLPVRGYEGLYEVSNLGRVRSHKSGSPRILKGGPGTTPMRYLRVTLRDQANVQSVRYIHTMVLEAFVGPRPTGLLALHRDGSVANCRLSNLRWGTAAENSADRVRHGHHFSGQRNPNSKLTSRQIKKIRSDYAAGRQKQPALAARYGVSQAHVSRIILNQTWG